LQSGVADQKVVVFRVGREEYAVTIAAVEEVVSWMKPTPVPEAPPVVEGVVDHRGVVLPIIDLGKLFRTERLRGEDAKVIVLDFQGQKVGLVVDEVSEVHTLVPGSIAPPSPVLVGGSGASMMVTGIAKLGEGRLVALVDPGRVLAHAEAR
jgi:purine-binding chemotaxis protein CheW